MNPPPSSPYPTMSKANQVDKFNQINCPMINAFTIRNDFCIQPYSIQ